MYPRRSQGTAHPGSQIPAADYPGISAAEGLAALAPTNICGRHERGGAANSPYQECHLTRVGDGGC